MQVVEQVEMTIMNQSKAFSPKRKALLIFALTKEVEKAEALERKFLLSQQSIIEMYDFMSIFRSDKDVEDIFRGIDFLPKEENSQKVKTWVDKICRIHTHACNTPSGKNYFDRLPEVNGQYGKELDWIIDKAEAMAGSAEKLLDIGCGNGRHLNYIHQHRPRLMLNGIDTSEYAIQLAKHRELRGDMPSGTFYQADMRHLPFPDNTFDIVISRFSLFCLPLSPTGEGGLHEVMREVARVLKPGGMMYGLTRRGKGISFYCLAQLLEREDVELLAHQTGLDVHGFHEFDINNTLHKGNEFNKIHSAISSCISFQLIKPLNWSKPE